MTREKLVEIMSENLSAGGMDICDCEISGFADAAEHILLALNQERVGEVVLWEGLAKSGEAEFMMRQSHGDNPSVCLFPIEYAKVKGKRGKLIFREQEGK